MTKDFWGRLGLTGLLYIKRNGKKLYFYPFPVYICQSHLLRCLNWIGLISWLGLTAVEERRDNRFFLCRAICSLLLQVIRTLLENKQFDIWSKKIRLSFTLCPVTSDPFYIVSYYIKWVTTSWRIPSAYTSLYTIIYFYIFL